MPTITGTPSGDTLTGTNQDDTITGDDGNDTIVDRWGDDIIEGGDGDDVIVDEGGSNTILGGAGDDRITISDVYAGSSSSIFSSPRTNIVDAGTGNDFVTIGRLGSGDISVDLGDGDDVLEITHQLDAAHTLTLGAGRDHLLLRFDYGNGMRFSTDSLITVADFTAGAAGDILDIGDALRGYFNNPSPSAAFDGNNPFTNGVLLFVQDGADTLIQIDYDGDKVNGIPVRTFLRLENVNASSLTAENFAGFDLGGAFPSVITVNGTAADDLLIAPAVGSDINAGAGNDQIIGSFRADEIDGQGGNDIIEGGMGNDILRGGDGDDLITDEGGNDLIEGGAGNDRIEIFREGIPISQPAVHETITVNAGEGDDYVRLTLGRNRQTNSDARTARLTADLGAGNDVVELTGDRNRAIAEATITLGDGQDRVILGGLRATPVTITDFEVGAAGDIIDIAQAIDIAPGWDLVSNPFASGHLYVEQNGDDTLVIFDYNGNGGASSSSDLFSLLRLSDVDASTLTAANFAGFNPDGTASTITIASGTPNDDVLTGSYGADVINGGAGNDVIEELFGGSDTLDGGDGDDVIRVATGFSPTSNDLTINAGTGNDLVEFSLGESSGETHSANIDLGSGDDRVIVRSLPSRGTTITLGTGRDILELDIGLASQSLGSLVVTDFETGAAGDLLDWNLYLFEELREGAPDYNPFTDDRAQLVQSGNDTLLQIRDNGPSFPYVTLITFQNTSVGDFTDQNLGFPLNRPTLVGTDADETLAGEPEDDVIYGRDGNDIINGFAGNDRLYGEGGNDTINGGDDDDQIEGGLGDDIIHGDDGNDFILGGAGRNTIFGDAGDDTIEDNSGLDLIDGGTGDDEITVSLSQDAFVVFGQGEELYEDVDVGHVMAGAGNDLVTITNAFVGMFDPGLTPSYSVDLGAGDDRLITDGHFGTITLGTGRDVIEFVAGIDIHGSVITDFEAGANGDIVDIGQSLGFGLGVASDAVLNLLENGVNPFELGVFELQQQANDVVLIFNPSVSGNFPTGVVLTFQNTNLGDFTSENFAGYDPFAVPVVPTYIESTTTIGSGQTITQTNTVPDDSVLRFGSSHLVYRANDASDYVNNGTVTTIMDELGYGIAIGFAVSRFSGPQQGATFHNTETGEFIVDLRAQQEFGIVSTSEAVYGFYAPQQGVDFLNEGFFSVTSSFGIAYGVLSGFDGTLDRSVVNTGTFGVSSAYGAIGVRLGFGATFENSGSISAIAPTIAVGVDWNQYRGGSFTNSGSILAQNSSSAENASIGVLISEGHSLPGDALRVFTNTGEITADIAFLVLDTSPPYPHPEQLVNSGIIEGAILLGAGDDQVLNTNGGEIYGTILLEAGNDLYDGIGGIQFGGVRGGLGDDTYRIDNLDVVLVEEAGEGTDTVEATINFTLAANFENLTLIGNANIAGIGNDAANVITGNDASNFLTGGGGADQLDGGGNIDTAIVNGNQADYTVTQTSTGVFQVVGADGADTLTNVEYLQFDDATIRLRPGTGVSVNFETADPSIYQTAMDNIRDFGGNDLGGDGNWLRIGAADVNGDGDIDQILVNDAIGRFATIGAADDGLFYFDDHGWAGETRVAGTYIDPLVASGAVEAGGPNDSQTRFQNDLEIENINRVLGADDYDGDGLQEVYFALTDGTAYLHAYMHADGNIQYANYQSQQEVIDFLTANGFGPEVYADWFPSGAEAAQAAPPSTVNEAPPERIHEFSDDVWAGGYVEPNGLDVAQFQFVEAFA